MSPDTRLELERQSQALRDIRDGQAQHHKTSLAYLDMIIGLLAEIRDHLKEPKPL